MKLVLQMTDTDANKYPTETGKSNELKRTNTSAQTKGMKRNAAFSGSWLKDGWRTEPKTTVPATYRAATPDQVGPGAHGKEETEDVINGSCPVSHRRWRECREGSILMERCIKKTL